MALRTDILDPTPVTILHYPGGDEIEPVGCTVYEITDGDHEDFTSDPEDLASITALYEAAGIPYTVTTHPLHHYYPTGIDGEVIAG